MSSWKSDKKVYSELRNQQINHWIFWEVQHTAKGGKAELKVNSAQ